MVNFAKSFQKPSHRCVTVEDFIYLLFNYRHDTSIGTQMDDWNTQFVESIFDATHINQRPLTTGQVKVVTKLICRFGPVLVDLGVAQQSEVEALIRHPRFARTVRESIYYPREVRHLGGDRLGFRFRRNDAITLRIKKLGTGFEWDTVNRVWVVEVTARTIDTVMSIITDFDFGFDDDVAELLAEITNYGSETVFYVDPQTGQINAVVAHPFVERWARSLLGAVY